MITLYSTDDARRELVLLGERNLPPEMVDLTRILPFDAPALTARAIASGSVKLLSNLAEAPPDLTMPRELGLRFGFGSLVAVPLMVRGHAIGAVTYATRQPRQFSPQDMEAVRTIGDIIAVGLENARLYDAAQDERSRLMTVIESSPEAIIFFEAPDGQIVLANKAAQEVVGQPLEHEAPMAEHPKTYGLCRADGSIYPHEQLPSSRALRGEVILGEEVFVSTPSDQMVPILVNAAPIRDTSGQVAGALAIFQDISRIKDLERQREEFISVVAHDLRGALTIVQGYADYLTWAGEKESLSEQVRDALEEIAVSSRRMGRMISDLLDVSRIEARRLALEREPVDLSFLVKDVVRRSGPLTQGHEVRVDVAAVVPEVDADPDRLEQVLANLLSNAGKYSHEGSEIRVGVESGQGEVMISVTNQGPGVEMEEREQLFTRFHRTRQAQDEKVPGLGLGLYIARGLVEAHGGRIWVESEPGKYATFCLTLPVARP